MDAEQKYCSDRSDAGSAIGAMLKSGQAAGFTNDQILDDIKDALYDYGVKVEITEAS